MGASTPEDYGGYYAWGETSEKSVYMASTYAYNSNHGIVDIGSDIANTSYDAATANMGAPWRMPSSEQSRELTDNCSHKWMQQNGVDGILVTGRNGGQIFLPAAGGCSDELYKAGCFGYYWSSSINHISNAWADYMYFNSVGDFGVRTTNRHIGHSVRAVRP